MFKKIIGLAMISFLFVVQVGCCVNNKYSKPKDVLNAEYLNFKFKNKNKILHNQNFVFLTSFVMTRDSNNFNSICYVDEDKSDLCYDPLVPLTSASGYVVNVNKEKINVLTAAHWCKTLNTEDIMDATGLIFEKDPLVGMYATFMGNDYLIEKKPIMNEKDDLCLIEFESKFYKYAKNMKVANKAPDIGEEIYAISAPQWSHEDEIRQHYQGKFAGCNSHECSFTIPATFGSSGSSVINGKGEIVSIIAKAAVDFNNLAVGPKPEAIKQFLKENL